jgi:hypothetical protein
VKDCSDEGTRSSYVSWQRSDVIGGRARQRDHGKGVHGWQAAVRRANLDSKSVLRLVRDATDVGPFGVLIPVFSPV